VAESDRLAVLAEIYMALAERSVWHRNERASYARQMLVESSAVLAQHRPFPMGRVRRSGTIRHCRRY
jgi:hypothetical protein